MLVSKYRKNKETPKNNLIWERKTKRMQVINS